MNRYKPRDDIGLTHWYVVVLSDGTFKPGITRDFARRVSDYQIEGHDAVFAKALHEFDRWSLAEEFEQRMLGYFREVMTQVRGEEYFDLRSCADPLAVWAMVGMGAEAMRRELEPAAPLLMLRKPRTASVDPAAEEPYRMSENESLRLRANDGRVYHYLSGKVQPEDHSRAIWLTLNTLIRLGYTDQRISNLLWYGGLQAKPRERGAAWLGDEIARARLELTEGRIPCPIPRPGAP